MAKKKSTRERGTKSNPVIIVAIIGLAGTIVISLFAYLTTRTQIDTPSISTPVPRDAVAGPQKTTMEMTLSNNSQSMLEITIRSGNGVTTTLEIPPGARQTIAQPSGDYSYTYRYLSEARSLPPLFRGIIVLTRPLELCFFPTGVTLCDRSPVFIWIAGIASAILIVLLIVLVRKRRGHQSESANG